MIRSPFYVSLVIILFAFGIGFAQNESSTFTIHLLNNSGFERTNEVVEVALDSLITLYPNFNFNSFKVSDGKKAVTAELAIEPSQSKKLLLLLDFSSAENKQLTFSMVSEQPDIKKYTQAFLGEKKDYVRKEGFYTGGKFTPVSYTKVPADHFAHDALYQFEGPGWESGNVGYRLYLDERNRTDIFGKSKPELILNEVGKNDLISDGNESYQKPLDWGQDIFKVGNSLGIGSVASFNDSVVTISKTDSVTCELFNNNLLSGILMNHYGWNINNEKYNASIMYSIAAKSRLTHVQVSLDKEIKNICTGLAKHNGTEFIKSSGLDGWNYIALWGKQTLVNDNLGIAVFYNNSQLDKLSEDKLSYFVNLELQNNIVNYYFAATWEQEKNGIKTKAEFIRFLESEKEKLNNPIKITFE